MSINIKVGQRVRITEKFGEATSVVEGEVTAINGPFTRYVEGPYEITLGDGYSTEIPCKDQVVEIIKPLKVKVTLA